VALAIPNGPDPTGRDPHGVSTAPRSWTNVHRALGYLFVLTYAALLFEMLPRAWEFRVATPLSVVHGILGLLIGVILAVKIAIIRRFRRFGLWLPWLGGALAVTTLATVGLGFVRRGKCFSHSPRSHLKWRRAAMSWPPNVFSATARP